MSLHIRANPSGGGGGGGGVTSVNGDVGPAVVVDTDNITEGSSNLYYTTARSQGDSLVSSVAGRTGAVSIAHTDVSGLGTSSVIDVGTTANKVVQLTAAAKLPAVDGSLLTGLPSAPVTSVNTAVGAVVLDTDDVTEGSSNLYYTDVRADARITNATGTTAGDLVQLDAVTAKLPAVDGSLLTNLPGGGGGGWTYAAITSASSPVTASTSYHYGSNTSSGVIVFNLPALSGLSGGEQIRVKLNTAGNNLTITPNGSDTVEGAATFVLSVVKSSVTMIADSGTNWEIV